MLKDFTKAEHLYIATGFTDMRKGLEGLALLVEKRFGLDPFSNSLFLFCGRKTDRLKALYYDTDGFILLTKRLDSGRYQWPRNGQEAAELTLQQYRWLMDGLSVEQPKAIRSVGKYTFG